MTSIRPLAFASLKTVPATDPVVGRRVKKSAVWAPPIVTLIAALADFPIAVTQPASGIWVSLCTPAGTRENV